MKTLEEIEFEVILHRLAALGFNYTKTSKSLGISYRGFSNKLKKIKKLFPDRFNMMFEKSELVKYTPEDHIWKGMPSNEERLKYLDG